MWYSFTNVFIVWQVQYLNTTFIHPSSAKNNCVFYDLSINRLLYPYTSFCWNIPYYRRTRILPFALVGPKSTPTSLEEAMFLTIPTIDPCWIYNNIRLLFLISITIKNDTSTKRSNATFVDFPSKSTKEFSSKDLWPLLPP